MKDRSRIPSRVAAVALAIALAGCGAANETAPTAGTSDSPVSSAKVPTAMLARSQVYQIGVASSNIAFSPTVVVLDQDGVPIQNVEVHFAVATGGGSVAPEVASTDAYGVVTASWRLGDAAGENTLVVTVPGIPQVLFKADAVVPANSSRWDLQLVGGVRLPLTYSGGGATWTLTGGHYVLLNDSTYTFGYDIDGVNRLSSIGRYIRVDSSHVQFYLQPGSYPASTFYQDRGGLFSTGEIRGDVMTVTYEDPVDFDIETYVASSVGSSSLVPIMPGKMSRATRTTNKGSRGL